MLIGIFVHPRRTCAFFLVGGVGRGGRGGSHNSRTPPFFQRLGMDGAGRLIICCSIDASSHRFGVGKGSG